MIMTNCFNVDGTITANIEERDRLLQGEQPAEGYILPGPENKCWYWFLHGRILIIFPEKAEATPRNATTQIYQN